MPTKLEKVLYTAHVHTTGGRDGATRSDDGAIDFKLAVPKEMGGPGGGPNPELLFAAGYSACYLSALKHVAAKNKVSIPPGTAVDAGVSLGPIEGGFGLAVQLTTHLPGMDPKAAQDLVDQAHVVCPYSNATRGNIEVELVVDVE